VKSLLLGGTRKAVFSNGYVTCDKIKQTLEMFLDKNEVLKELPGETKMYDLVRVRGREVVEVVKSNVPYTVCAGAKNEMGVARNNYKIRRAS